MPRKAHLKLVLPAILFATAAALTLLAVKKWRAQSAETAKYKSLDETPGLVPGEAINLPEFVNLKGETVTLKEVKGQYVLCVIISTSCPRCVEDVELWKALSDESPKKNVAFYLISPDDTIERMKKFAEAHSIENLPILTDPRREVARSFKTKVIPQYVLLTADGRVVGRWNGLRHYNAGEQGAKQIEQFFKPMSEQQ